MDAGFDIIGIPGQSMGVPGLVPPPPPPPPPITGFGGGGGGARGLVLPSKDWQGIIDEIERKKPKEEDIERELLDRQKEAEERKRLAALERERAEKARLEKERQAEKEARFVLALVLMDYDITAAIDLAEMMK